MVVGIALSGVLGWSYPTSLSAMASYQILTLVVDWSIRVHLQPTSVIHSSSDKLCPISSLFVSFILEVTCYLDEEMLCCCF